MKNNIIIVLVSVGISAIIGFASGDTQTIVKEKPVGAVASPDINSPYFSVGGVQEWRGRQSFQTGTNTVIAIQAPVTGTSTLLQASCDFISSSSTGATLVQFTKNATAYGTTTVIGTSLQFATGTTGFFQASTTPTGTAVVFKPGEYLTVGMYGYPTLDSTSRGTVSPTGSCVASWMPVVRY